MKLQSLFSFLPILILGFLGCGLADLTAETITAPVDSAAQVAPLDGLLDPGGPIIGTVLNLASQYPVLATVVIIIGSLRVLFKPIFAAANYYVSQTPGTTDDEFLRRVEGSRITRTLAFFLDLFASIKIRR